MTFQKIPLRIDLHVHTKRYSACAEFMGPFEIDASCREAGIDAVVFTDHDWLWTEAEISEVRARSQGTRFFRGIECSADGCHIILIGLEDAAHLRRGMPPGKVIDIAHGQGAVAILAHPFRDTDPFALPLEEFDAIEVDSTSFVSGDPKLAFHLARSLDKPTVASSDAHALSRLGWAWTEFDTEPADEKELAELVHQGRGRPVLHPQDLPAPVRSGR